MRKVTFGVANSLDNYIARPDDAVDWLLWSDEAKSLMKDFWVNIDTVLMGRGTYEAALKMGHGAGDKSMTTYVFSRTLKEIPDAHVQLVSEDAGQFVRDLKSREGKDIYLMGGGGLAQSLFNADLIDEVGVNIHPVLLGSGIPLFLDMDRQIDLELIECRPLTNGCVYVSYRVKR